jgi:hypothetical protein
MAVDFTLAPEETLTEGQLVHVPLMVLNKESLRNFDVVDEEGRSLTVLTARQNGELAARGLALLLWDLWPPELPTPETVIAPIVQTEDPHEATQLLDNALASGQPLQQALEHYAEVDRRDVIRALLTELARGFMLLVPVEYRAGSRRLIKFSYDAAHRPIPIRRARQHQLSQPPLFRRLASRMLRFLASCGFAARIEDFEGLPVGWSESYHSEIVPPPDSYLAETSLEIRHAEETERVRDDHRFRGHVRGHGRARGDRAQLTVLLQVQREALVLPLFIAAAALAGTLAYVPSHAAELDTQALSALLLVPVALVAYYVRSTENSYVRASLRGLRLIAGVPALAGILILAMIGLRFLGTSTPDETAISVSRWSAHAALWSAVLLSLALINPWLGEMRRRFVRVAQDQANEWPRRLVLALLTALSGLGFLALGGAVLFWLYRLLPI